MFMENVNFEEMADDIVRLRSDMSKFKDTVAESFKGTRSILEQFIEYFDKDTIFKKELFEKINQNIEDKIKILKSEIIKELKDDEKKSELERKVKVKKVDGKNI